LRVVNTPLNASENYGLVAREFAKAFGADELDFEHDYDSIVLRKGNKAFRIGAHSSQGYDFLSVERIT